MSVETNSELTACRWALDQERARAERAEQERDTARHERDAALDVARVCERDLDAALERVRALEEALRGAHDSLSMIWRTTSDAHVYDEAGPATRLIEQALQAGAPAADIGEPASGQTCLSCGRLPGFCEPYCGAAPAAEGEGTKPVAPWMRAFGAGGFRDDEGQGEGTCAVMVMGYGNVPRPCGRRRPCPVHEKGGRG